MTKMRLAKLLAFAQIQEYCQSPKFCLADEEDEVATTFGPCPNLDNHVDPPKTKSFALLDANWVSKAYILFLGLKSPHTPST